MECNINDFKKETLLVWAKHMIPEKPYQLVVHNDKVMMVEGYMEKNIPGFSCASGLITVNERHEIVYAGNIEKVIKEILNKKKF